MTGDTTTPRRLPGVEGLWVFLGFDMVVFALLFGSFASARHDAPALFEASRQTLDLTLGGVDTLILLTSAWLVALGVQSLARDETESARWLLGGIGAGLLFVVSKSVEYAQKLAAGITPATDPFFLWYFLLTGVHLLHVLAGLVALTIVWRGTRRGSARRTVVESVASFWHLVDLLWLMIFPLLYLQR